MTIKPGEVGYVDAFTLKEQKARYIKDIKACKTEDELEEVLRRIAQAVNLTELLMKGGNKK